MRSEASFHELLLLLLLLLVAHASACPVKSCCSMTRAELESCVGVHAQCRSPGKLPQVENNRCVECARGQCRLSRNLSSPLDNCLCPSGFLGNRSLQESCATAHNAAWPASAAATKPDLDRRHCAGAVFNATGAVRAPPPPVPARVAERCPVKPCCAMTRTEVDACRGLVGTKPLPHVLRNTCVECPRGTCRLATLGKFHICWLARDFLDKKGHCKFTSGKHWPQSAGLPEMGRPRCAGARHLPSGELAMPLPSLAPADVMKCPVKDCCALTKKELLACRGLNENCPTRDKVGNVARASCGECPRGLCRLPGTADDGLDECLCPDDFYRRAVHRPNLKRHATCTESHGAPWPGSAGRTQIGRERCVEVNRAEVSKLPGSPTPLSENSSPSKAQLRRRFSPGELAGIITGTVSAVAAVAAVIVAALRREVFLSTEKPPRLFPET